MISLSLLSYLPPGWTESTYQNATSKDYNALPEDQLEKLMERKVEEVRHQTSQILHEARTWRAAHGIAVNQDGGLTWPPSPAADHTYADAADDVSLANMQRLVRHVEAAQWAEIGFLVFRTYYADEPLWERFQQRFGEVVDGGLVSAPAAAGLLARISGRVKLPLVSDYALVDLGPGGIAHIYRDSVSNLDGDDDDDESEEKGEEEGEEGDDDEGGHLASLDPGLRMPMCIMVDQECLRSMAGEKEEEEDGAVPYVKAVDVRLATNKDLGYSGSFKVAVGALMSHFYAALQFYEPVDISAAVDKSTGIWTGMGSVQPSKNAEEATMV
ncbi:hypothetical protein CRV24_000215 [Beauveria bassiana]|nr:hypothetical protein CRV24_000215 [Beauveria bassiana]